MSNTTTIEEKRTQSLVSLHISGSGNELYGRFPAEKIEPLTKFILCCIELSKSKKRTDYEI